MEEVTQAELECPVCLETMIPPITLCVAGHNVCSNCKKRVPSCPMCKSSFCGRNRALEEIAKKFQSLHRTDSQNNSYSALDILNKYRNKNLLSEQIGNTIETHLKCKVCKTYSFSQIYFCENGHSTCQKCQRCTKCDKQKSTGRNLSLERIVKISEYPCPYKKFGCFFIMTTQLVSHEATCEYKPLRCPMSDIDLTNCAWFGTREDLKTHLVASHIACKVSDNPNQVLCFGNSSNTVIFALTKIFVISILIKNAAVLYRISLVGTESEFLKYKCMHNFYRNGAFVHRTIMNPSPRWFEFTNEVFGEHLTTDLILKVSIFGA